jgi:hypothetical protein
MQAHPGQHLKVSRSKRPASGLEDLQTPPTTTALDNGRYGVHQTLARGHRTVEGMDALEKLEASNGDQDIVQKNMVASQAARNDAAKQSRAHWISEPFPVAIPRTVRRALDSGPRSHIAQQNRHFEARATLVCRTWHGALL